MEETETKPNMLTVQEVQYILKIGRNKVYEVFAREDFPAICLGRKFVVEQKAFDNWLQSRRESKKWKRIAFVCTRYKTIQFKESCENANSIYLLLNIL